MGPLAFIAPALQFITGSGELSKLARYGLLAVGVLIAYQFWHHKVFTDGREYERGLIAAQDSKAIQAAQGKRNEYRVCVDAKGVEAWDRLTGSCKH